MLHVMNADQKIKKYIKIAVTLTVITVLELAVVYFSFLPSWLITLLVVVLSLSKAYMVAWHFMHLNHERAWTRIVAILPLGMVVYAGVLIADQKFRPISTYIGEPARTNPNPAYPPSGAHGGADAAVEPQAHSHPTEATIQNESGQSEVPVTAPEQTGGGASGGAAHGN